MDTGKYLEQMSEQSGKLQDVDTSSSVVEQRKEGIP